MEDAKGRFHASLAFRREVFDRIGGWPLTKRGDFEQQLIAQQTAIEAPGDPCQLDSPSYIFRWSQTNAYHGQAFMRGPDDEGWYERVAGLQAQRPGLVAFTVATQSLMRFSSCVLGLHSIRRNRTLFDGPQNVDPRKSAPKSRCSCRDDLSTRYTA